MTKRSAKTTIAVVVAVLVVCIVALCLFFLVPRQLVNVAKTGKLDNVQSIVYRSAPCCGYMEGAEFEYTITDSDTIEQVVAQYNSAKMQWTMPQLIAGGSREDITFKTATGEKKVNFSNRKIGNYKFYSSENPLTELTKTKLRPNLYIQEVYQINFRHDVYIVDSEEAYRAFINNVKVEQGNDSSLTFEYIDGFNYIAINLKPGSSSRNFYLTKVTQTGTNAYQLLIENKYDKNITAKDDTVIKVAYVKVSKDININNITYDIVQ